MAFSTPSTVSTPTSGVANLSMCGRPKQPLSMMSPSEHLWEAIDYWTSFSTQDLQTDEYFVQLRRQINIKIKQLPSDRIVSWPDSRDIADTSITHAALEHLKDIDERYMDLGKWRERRPMVDRMIVFVEKLESRLEQAFQKYQTHQDANETFQDIQLVIAAARRDITKRRHDNADDERRYFILLLDIILRNLEQVMQDESLSRAALTNDIQNERQRDQDADDEYDDDEGECSMLNLLANDMFDVSPPKTRDRLSEIHGRLHRRLIAMDAPRAYIARVWEIFGKKARQ